MIRIMAANPSFRPLLIRPGVFLLLFVLVGAGRVVAWDLPPDKGTLSAAAVKEILAGNDYPVTSGYSQRIEFIDFVANGRPFTQVVVILTPDTPRLHRGRRLVVVVGEPGSEYGMDFVSTVEMREGPAVWLARRGITFIALTRVGRWNFLASDGSKGCTITCLRKTVLRW